MIVPKARRVTRPRAQDLRTDLTGHLKTRRTKGAWPGASRRSFKFRWASAVSSEEWAIYSKAIDAVRAAEVPFMLGGGFALAAYTGRWRDTKDIDFYIRPEDREAAVQALN